MKLSFALFGHEILSFNIDRDDELTSLALSALMERNEDDSEDVPFGFSPPGGNPQ